MKSLLKKALAVLLTVFTVFNVVACGGGGGDNGGAVTIKFFGWGNETEQELTEQLRKEFNIRLFRREIMK